MSLAQQWTVDGLRARDFTAVFGVDDPHGLAVVLQRQDKQQPYRGAYGIHNLRWMLFDPARGAPSQHQILVLAMVVDGAPLEVLAALAHTKAAALEQVLSHCRGFDAAAPIVEYVKRHATPSGYLFRDLGPLSEDDAEPDATLAEVENAYAMQLSFERLYERYSQGHAPQPMPAAALRQAFTTEFRCNVFPFPLTRFEKRQPDEQVWVRRMLDASRRQQTFAAAAATDGKVRRAVHAKAHGLIRAKFRVRTSAIPIGLFSAEGTYDAVLRLSNGSPRPAKDRNPDARGLALRVLIPPGQRFAGNREPAFLPPQEHASAGKQDFVMMDSRVFFVRNIRRLALLTRIVSESNLHKLVGLLEFTRSPGGLREMALLGKAMLALTRDPLAKRYHSTTPYLLGPHHIVKYSLEPIEKQGFRAWVRALRSPSTADILKQRLCEGDVRLRFFVHVLSDRTRPKGKSLSDIVENATLDWRRLKAEKIHVADVEIRRQDPTTAERMQEAEQLQFSPWNALEEHRPLGNLNRARWFAYPESQRFRTARPVAVSLAPQPASSGGQPAPASVPAPASEPKAAE